MAEADRLLHNLLEAGDIVGRDPAGRIVIQVAIEPPDFERLMAFGADAVESEDGGDDELGQALPQSVCWFWEAAPAFAGCPLQA